MSELQSRFGKAMRRHMRAGGDPDLMIEAAMFVLLDNGDQNDLPSGKLTDPRDDRKEEPPAA